ncbi:type II secretion system protein N [Castellaniella sp.]|uniref:type II secretion system protein N n=1 Tax=Castellaniella sp. TaxID=1955812 RepID=UPI002AFFD140|nr:type II secretion system protein N [Castellaniella sp.]
MPVPHLPAIEFLHRHGPDLLHGTALLAIAGGIGLWGTLLLAPQPDPAPPMLAVAPAPAPSLDTLAGWFGSGRGRLQVRMTGLIAAGPRGTAILSIDGAPARAFRVGDTLAPGVTLTEVHAHGIVVSQDGMDDAIAAPPSAALAPGFIPADQPRTGR